jgi:gluconolactonase
MRKILLTAISLMSLGGLLSACGNEAAEPVIIAETPIQSIGSVEMLTQGIIAPEAKIENLGGSFGWSEGPIWIPEQDRLLFTDVPGNIIWSYKDGEGLTEFLSPSGLAGVKPDHIGSAGANGLIRLNEDEILLPSHGERGLYAMNLETKDKRLIVGKYEGRQFNSPNDAVLHSTGILYFTDPPYGLSGQDDSEAKELPFNGVYALYPDGRLIVIDKELTRPNGIILSPDESVLYVANSDSRNNIWKAYPVSETGDVGEGRLFLDATADLDAGEVGLADGMAMDTQGRIYATGPGGVIVISPTGERLGLIRTGKRIANVTFGGPNGTVLYMTSADILARVPTLVKGHGF